MQAHQRLGSGATLATVGEKEPCDVEVPDASLAAEAANAEGKAAAALAPLVSSVQAPGHGRLSMRPFAAPSLPHPVFTAPTYFAAPSSGRRRSSARMKPCA